MATVVPSAAWTNEPPAVIASGTASEVHRGKAEASQDVDQMILDHLDACADAMAVVHFIPHLDPARCQLRRLRFNLPAKRAKSLAGQLISVCQQVAQTHSPQHRRQLAPERIILGIPIPHAADHLGEQQRVETQCEVLGVIASNIDDLDSFVRHMEQLTGRIALSNLVDRLNQESEAAQRASAAVELVTRALHGKDRRETCQVIVTELAEHLNLQRAAIGIRTGISRNCRLMALSDTSRIDATTAQTRGIEDAMDETLMFGKITVAGRDQDSGQLGRAVSALAKDQAACVIAVPLLDDDLETGGVLLAILQSNQQLAPVQDFLRAATPVLTSTIDVVSKRNSSGILQRSIAALKSKRGLIAALAATVLGLAMLVPVPHRETCEVTVEPSLKRFVTAPFDATLQESFVVPGDLVSQGDRLAVLDGRELRWKRDALQADHDQAVKKRDAAQASRAYADQRIAQLDVDRMHSELQLLDHRLGALELLSPVDGIVVAGDLKRVQGAPLTTGQSLFEVAPLGEMVIEAAVPDDRVAYVAAEQSATLRLHAYPGECWETTIRSIHPRSEIRDEENVFIAESLLSNTGQMMRPGMKGTIKIECGNRRLGWVLFHRPVDAVRQWLWW